MDVSAHTFLTSILRGNGKPARDFSRAQYVLCCFGKLKLELANQTSPFPPRLGVNVPWGAV